jgi:hypothetical protein
MIDAKDIENRFTYHTPITDQVTRYEQIRNFGHGLATVINNHAPDSREKALALTKIEEAVMWANAAIARNETVAEPTGES